MSPWWYQGKYISRSDQEKDENEKIGEKLNCYLKRPSTKTVAIDKNNFKCSKCGEIFSRKSNLSRRFDRKHKGVILNKPQKGKYVGLQYGERFHKVMDMREYLCEDHKFVFIYETKLHSADAGL